VKPPLVRGMIIVPYNNIKISDFVTHQFDRIIDIGCPLPSLCASSIILLDEDHRNGLYSCISHKLPTPAMTEITVVNGKEIFEFQAVDMKVHR
jgi:hypothetical protein